MRPVRPSLQKVLRFGLLAALASCGQLECDQQKQKAIEQANAGVELLNRGQADEAIKKLELALSLDKGNHSIAWNLGQARMKKVTTRYGKLTDEECVKTPECKDGWAQAASAYEDAAKNNPKEAVYFYRLGEAHYKAGNLQPALNALQKAVELNKRLFKAHYFIGRIHLLMDQPKEAAAAWSEACRLNPSFGKPFIDLGRLYMRWDYYAEAAKVLEQGAMYAKEAEADDRTNIFYELGMAYDALAASATPPNPEYWKKAVEAYKKALEEKADNNDARFQLGFTYANLGDKANARKYLDEYIKSAGGQAAMASQVYAANQRMLKLVMD